MSYRAADPNRFSEFFSQVPWFAGLPEDARIELATGCSWRRISGGDVLFYEGEASDAVYLLVHGSLAAFQNVMGGKPRLVGQIMAGETVGELGVLVSQPRSATIRALRDSELIALPAAHLEAMTTTFPQAMLSLARLALRRRGDSTHDATPRTMALLPHSAGVDLEKTAAQLAHSLSAFGSVRTLDAKDAGGTAGDYHEIEKSARFVLYVANGDDPNWRDQCRRQADALLFIVRAAEHESGTAIWAEAEDERVTRQQHLMLVHDAKPRLGAARRWHAHCPQAALHHLRDERDVARLARLIAGRSLALVLSGGGARGFAHIGVVRALREAEFEIDSVAGTSIGAVIAAAVAAEWSIEEITERFRQVFYDQNPLSDYTLPFVSLVSGRKMTRLLQDTFGERDIEDLLLPYFCVSANLTRGDAMIHRDGKLWQALRASAAIPGFVPPVFKGGEVFVDGGVVNNLPVDLMRQVHRGEVIAVDIGGDHALHTRVEEYSLPPAWRLWVESRTTRKRPSLREILLRAGMVNSSSQSNAARALSSLLIRPPLGDIGLLDWQSYYRAIDRGYQHALRQIGGPKDALADEPPLF